MAEPVGLLAGAGRFPVAFADKMHRLGRPLVCVAFRGLADPALKSLATKFHWCSVYRLGRMINCFRAGDVRSFVMAGKIPKTPIIGTPWRLVRLCPDLRMLRMWFGGRRDNRDDSILLSIIAEFERDGLHCASALDFCPELLVKPGTLTRRQPTSSELRDIEFGWGLAKEMGRLDVGQSVIVKERAVLAVEAIEGTDAAIQRAGELCRRGGFTVVKVAKPDQDRRFDVPTVGRSTIETIHRAGGTVLAVEGERTILLDAPDTIALTDRLGMSIVAR
jgi:UDP-2,3-diacylglucosamine hydrolase